mgnify:CR=1 FL=1
MRYYIGIDIGKLGAIVIQDIKTNEILTFPMPILANELDVKKLNDFLLPFKDSKETICAFEDLRAIFNVSAKSTFSFGFIAGITEGIVSVLNIPYVKVQAKIWQKQAFLGIKEIRKPSKIDKNGKERKGGLETKQMALLAAKRLYPNTELRATQKSKKEHEGIVDALLISWWLIQNYR